MKRSIAFVLATLAGVVPSALAQVARPPFFVWSSGGRPYEGSGSSTQYVITPDLITMSRHYNDDDQPLSLQNAVASADWVAADIIARTTPTLVPWPDQITPEQTCVSFHTFGLDDVSCDSAAARVFSGLPGVDGAFYLSPLTFFTEGDRLRLDLNGLPNNPDGLDANFGFPDPPPLQHSFGRTYRNPVMLKNATSAAPLRAWMVAFCEEYKAIQQYRVDNNLVPALPDIARMYLDNEAGIASELDKDALWILRQLAKSEQNGPTSEFNYWSNHEVPGTGGKTLATLYGEAVALYGLPSDIFNSTSGLRPSESPDSDNNRPFMLWYVDICRQARDAVLKNCFYDVVPLYFENCKTSNYEQGRTDGVPDSTGYFVDSLGTSYFDAASGHEVYPDRDESVQLPRGWPGFNDRLTGRFWDEVSGVWDVSKTYSSGTENSPVFYSNSVNPTVFGNYSNDDQDPGYGARQPNLYRGPRVSNGEDHKQILETQIETALRLFRHMIESCINSYGGLHDDQMVPWIGPVQSGEAPTPQLLRRLLLMLRAHRVPEVAVFSGANVELPDDRPLAFKQWKDTQTIIDQVYSPYVSSYKAAWGTLIEGEGDDLLPERLEYSLYEGTSNGERMVKLDSAPYTNPDDGQTVAMTSLEVDFQGLVNADNKGYFSTPSSDSVETGVAYGYTVSMDCFIKPQVGLTQGQLGKVEVYDWSRGSQGEWVEVKELDSVGESLADGTARTLNGDGLVYFFHAYPAANTTHTMRLTFDLRSPLSGGVPNQDFVARTTHTIGNDSYPRGTMRLRFTHIANNGDDQFYSGYDVVQIAPFPFPMSASGFPTGIVLGEPQPLHNSDGSESEHVYLPYTFEPMDPAIYPGASSHYANPIKYKRNPSAIWEPAELANMASVPRHYDDWRHYYEDSTNPSGHWPSGYNANTAANHNERLLNSLFSLPDGNPAKQVATMKLTGPIWTDAPTETPANLNVQPYSVWFWLTPTMQWAEVTAAMNVTIARDSTLQSGTVIVSSHATEPLQAGYYALTLNATPPLLGTPDPAYGERYAVYTGGAIATPGTLPLANRTGSDYAVVQYNFRLYPDCDNDGIIDATEAECNVAGTSGQCASDLDNGSGSGYPDGNVDVHDLLFFLNCWQQGMLCGDLDDGSGTGTKEGWVDINDLLYFLGHFAAGC